MTIAEFAQSYFNRPVMPSTKLIDLCDDSLEKADMILELENTFGVDILDDDLSKLSTLQDLEDYIDSHRRRN
jgi:acyl carrier protein